MAETPDLFDATADPEKWSNVSIGDKRLTWRELAENQRQELEHRGHLVTVLMDLNRCEHGRHEGDNCFGCDGPSVGNPIMRLADNDLDLFRKQPLRTIGFSLDASPIVIPERGSMGDPDAWLTR